MEDLCTCSMVWRLLSRSRAWEALSFISAILTPRWTLACLAPPTGKPSRRAPCKQSFLSEKSRKDQRRESLAPDGRHTIGLTPKVAVRMRVFEGLRENPSGLPGSTNRWQKK
uniref:Uncharacterized protein n=1 Tax=Odontella aurita TaxID=265563 RepID=A0A7S4K0I9_9STRA